MLNKQSSKAFNKNSSKGKSDGNAENILEKVEDLFLATAENVLPTKTESTIYWDGNKINNILGKNKTWFNNEQRKARRKLRYITKAINKE